MNTDRGTVLFANLEPAFGGEIKKIRPVVIVSNDINNRHNLTVTVVPITSNVTKIYPHEVYLAAGAGNLPKESKAKTDQIRTIDKSRLLKELGKLSKADMKRVETALRIHLSL